MAKKAKESTLDRLLLTRNIGIIAHIDAGKTTTTERILYYTGKTHQLGGVDEGTTTTDYNKDEQERGITIETAAVSCEWTPPEGTRHIINILDTPGHVDFTAEVERSLRVLDGAVGVFCAVGGVEAQSETVWRQADRYDVPRIAFINKLDRSGADFDAAINSMRDVLHANPVPIQRPVGLEKEFSAVLDLVEPCMWVWKDETLGAVVEKRKIPDEHRDEVELERQGMIDSLADAYDDVAEQVLEEHEFTAAELRAIVRRGTLERKFTPVLCGTSLRNKGVQPLIDAICYYLPSPLDRPPVTGKTPKRRKKSKMDSTETEDWDDDQRTASTDEPFSALVFKSITDKHSTLFFFRIYSGELKEGQMVLNLTRNKKERVSKIFRMHANRREQVKFAHAGDIVATVGFRYTRTGDTVCDNNAPILYETINFPDTVMSRAVEPKSTADQEKLLNVLKEIERDDPTFRYTEDEETRQLVISGMGELHLEIVKNRIEDKYGIQAKFRDLRVAYKQALNSKGRGTGKLDRELPSGKVQYAEVKVEVMRSVFGRLAQPLTISWDIEPDQIPVTIPRSYWSGVEEGLKGAATGSYSWGYPLIQTHVRVIGGSFDPANSSDEAFQAAASIAFEKAVEEAGIDLLEPLMSMEVLTPQDRFGDVHQDLTRRGAEIQSQEQGRGDLMIIKGKVPLASMFGYAADVRSVTNGRGNFTMEPLSYEIVPESRRPELY
jgi:elongation factor G